MPAPNQILCNNPTHQTLAQEIYKHSAELLGQQKHIESLLYNMSEAVIAVNTESKINIINQLPLANASGML